MLQPIPLPCYGITLYPTGDGAAGISSDLHWIEGEEHPDGEIGAAMVDAALNAVESLILAHYCAGVDVASPAYIEGIETTIQAIDNYYS